MSDSCPEYMKAGYLPCWPDVQPFISPLFRPVTVQAIGFDMDYTLAQYRPESFEVLAYELTVGKLIDEFQYPQVGHITPALLHACNTV